MCVCTTKFDVPNIKVVRKKILSLIFTKWRDLNTFLTREYMFRKHKDYNLHVKYQIS